MIKFRHLNASEVECRVAQCSDKGCSLLLYKDARCDMALLDETVGPENWQRHHSRENANCIISIWDNEKKQWIEKEDTGTESNTEAAKGLASDSFKRAGFNWGIGRELYTAPFIWIPAGKCELYDTKRADRSGKSVFGCKSKFVVADMTVENGTIVGLFIKRLKSKDMPEEMVFSFGKPSGIVCEECGQPISPTKKKDGSTWQPEDMAAYSRQRFGKAMCAACQRQAAKAGGSQ